VCSSDLMMMLGDRLRQLRQQAHLSQRQLARASGVPQPTVSNIEAGKQGGLTLANAGKLARGLGVPVNALVHEEESDKGDHDGQPE